MQAVAEKIYYEASYAGATIGAIIYHNGTLLIDSPLRSEDAQNWKASILARSRGSHHMMIILDIHADRTLGSRAIEYPILAHKLTAEAFQERSNVFKGYSNESGAEWEHFPEVSGTRWEHPHITFTQHLTLHWGGPEIHLEHRPGPTPRCRSRCRRRENTDTARPANGT